MAKLKHDQPWVAADCVVFDVRERLLLIRRKNPPFQGQYALPGGFVELGETTEHAALRELKEETGIEGRDPELIGVYSDPNRDPRHHCISAAYLLFVHEEKPTPGDDAAGAEFVEHWNNLALAFDHNKIVQDSLNVRARLRASMGHG
jgi:8-oxo-dGTP diphosphatase